LFGKTNHCETISDRNLERVKALGGGIAIQHRMAYQGEYFIDRYGKEAAERTPPVRKMLELGIPVGAGTDATRVASYNPWVSSIGWSPERQSTESRCIPKGIDKETFPWPYLSGGPWNRRSASFCPVLQTVTGRTKRDHPGSKMVPFEGLCKLGKRQMTLLKDIRYCITWSRTPVGIEVTFFSFDHTRS